MKTTAILQIYFIAALNAYALWDWTDAYGSEKETPRGLAQHVFVLVDFAHGLWKLLLRWAQEYGVPYLLTNLRTCQFTYEYAILGTPNLAKIT